MAKNNKTHAIRRQNSRHKAAKVCTARSKFVFLKNGRKSRQKNVAKKKSAKKWQKRQQKFGKKGGEKSLFLNLSCCCLETGLKPVLLFK